MAIVTVAGAHGQTVHLAFDSDANAILARKLAAAITAGVQGGTILPSEDNDGPPPPLSTGETGEFVQKHDGLTILPPGYKAFVNTAHEAVVFGSGDNDESVLSSVGNLTFFATGGSGTVAAGGGDNRIVIPASDKGDWSINTGNGDDTVLALGGGSDTINAGGGHNAIQLGDGKYVIQSTGDDSVDAGNGQETIAAFGNSHDVIFGHGSQLLYVGTDGGSATVYGGSGSDTFFGGKGPDLVYGGSGGNNYLFAGTGQATLFGGGTGDQLFAAGNKAQALHAGGGNETLFGGFASGQDTFYASTGSYDMTAGQGKDTFVFTSTLGGGTSTITGFASGQDKIDLAGYGNDEVNKALKSQQVVGNSDTITLSDHTTITFAGVNSLSSSDFITGGDGGNNGKGQDNGNNGNPGKGSQNADDHSHLRDSAFGPTSNH
jgi:Ca2+-binding RTX toxin-like protein